MTTTRTFEECIKLDANSILQMLLAVAPDMMADEKYVLKFPSCAFSMAFIKFHMTSKDKLSYHAYSKSRKVYEYLIELVSEKFREYLTNLETDLADSSISDGEFLLTLSKAGRDFRKDCCICLTTDIMGTTCTCGHTEIAVFRPCGHSICAKPCFYEFCESMGHELKPKEFVTEDGQRFITPSTMDIRTVKDFKCPMCRTTVNSVFRAEDTWLKLEDVVTVDCLTVNTRMHMLVV
jgi:hypothetical protein